MSATQHTPFIIVDAHQDIAFNYIEEGREYRQSAIKKRQSEDNSPVAVKHRGIATLGLPEALLGRVGVVFSTLYVSPAWSPFSSKYSYETPQQAYQQAMQQMDYYKRLFDEDEHLCHIRTRQDLQDVLATWEDGTEVGEHKQGMVILMEGADPIIEPPQVEEWYYEHGVRIVGTAWSETRYSGGTGRPGPLTNRGNELLDIMGDLGMILDLSHMAEEAYFQAIDRYSGTLIASHSNPRKFVDSDRMLSDKMIRLLAERNGVMGVVLFNRFIDQQWQLGDPKSQVNLDHVVAIIDYICQLTGSAQHVGIGSDFDGGFGREAIPAPLDTAADLLMLKDALLNRGYEPDDVNAILSGNFLRILANGLPES
jgi:membrane dipeptidase